MTETTQPDPRVVAWMRAYRSNLPASIDPSTARMETVREYRNAHSEEARRLGLRALVDAYAIAARKPLTVADIPAGQGAASLFIGNDPRGIGKAVLFKEVDGSLAWVDDWFPSPPPATAAAAWRDHLAVTLPTVTTEED
jgi:hypothetical protein